MNWQIKALQKINKKEKEKFNEKYPKWRKILIVISVVLGIILNFILFKSSDISTIISRIATISITIYIFISCFYSIIEAVGGSLIVAKEKIEKVNVNQNDINTKNKNDYNFEVYEDSNNENSDNTNKNEIMKLRGELITYIIDKINISEFIQLNELKNIIYQSNCNISIKEDYIEMLSIEKFNNIYNNSYENKDIVVLLFRIAGYTNNELGYKFHKYMKDNVLMDENDYYACYKFICNNIVL